MKIFIPKETAAGERRVAAVPESVAKLIKLGLAVEIESGAGLHANHSDQAYVDAGARIADGLSSADVVASIRPLNSDQISALKPEAITISFLSPTGDSQIIAELAKAKATAMSFDLVPRISRAQSMDALTSQALCAGYRATLIAAEKLPKFFPLFMTAAGRIQPARVLVLGAGVAGLQAMATAKRLGSVVSAYDVRSSSADEVRSMGATFIDLGLDVVEGTGGYAKEMAEDRAAAQQRALTPHVEGADVIITTAAIPGRPAPRLVTAEMLTNMKPGSVIVDLAAESGGNVEGSKPGEDVLVSVASGQITIHGGQNVPSQLPVHSSALFAQNVVALLTLMTTEGQVTADLEDEVIAGSAVVYQGTIRNQLARTALGMEGE